MEKYICWLLTLLLSQKKLKPTVKYWLSVVLTLINTAAEATLEASSTVNEEHKGAYVGLTAVTAYGSCLTMIYYV